MNRSLHNFRVRSFVLVMSLLLVVLLTATSAGLALTAATESITTASVARDLDHRLAVDSLLACFPRLHQAPGDRQAEGAEGQDSHRPALEFSGIRVECTFRNEAEKLFVGAAGQSSRLAAQLQALAQANGLTPEHVRVRPMQQDPDRPSIPDVVWFDQLVATAEFEELFHWSFPERATPPTSAKRTWSDLVSFWKARGESVLGLEIETAVGNDSRRWYVVVALADSRSLRVLYRGSVY